MRDVLQRPHVDLGSWRTAADHQNRYARDGGVGHCGDCVGDARAGGNHRDRGTASEFGMRVRHVDGGALVADIDDADAKPCGMVPDRLDVAALQTEHAVDPARFEETRDPGGAGPGVRAPIFFGGQTERRFPGHGYLPVRRLIVGLCSGAAVATRIRRA
jgi:hypothetical protein